MARHHTKLVVHKSAVTALGPLVSRSFQELVNCLAQELQIIDALRTRLRVAQNRQAAVHNIINLPATRMHLSRKRGGSMYNLQGRHRNTLPARALGPRWDRAHLRDWNTLWPPRLQLPLRSMQLPLKSMQLPLRCMQLNRTAPMRTCIRAGADRRDPTMLLPPPLPLPLRSM
jgi:hypothetical protein